ncbi:ras association domain-containing protein 3 isoform X1 [Salmo salar]|uniref:Ras association domain-containing protein 3 isoform X1 n=1 Tax=Salmo salar TaxID=8030 RepID=A0A1S3SG48_SALSA|nr:ras association domain-containing protein 3-like isoform X1 [Salmo salar]|eukprot:XP_014063306.1 PREDICTED: ras association domain-containing protein 3-like isoform X1 [Salmo salar]
MYHSKVKVVRAARRHTSTPSRSLENIEAVWSKIRADSLPNLEERRPAKVMNPAENGCPGRSSRKSGFKPPDVRTIFSPSERDSRMRGEGHTFHLGLSGAWCDVCCVYILHLSLMCSGCKYTCHPECRERVSLDCHPGGPVAVDTPLRQDHLNNNTPAIDVEQERELRTHLSREEIRQKVELYNSSSKDHLKMTLNPSGVYTGFIKVQLELRRPVTVRGGQGGEAFYLPQGAINTLHISSNNTVRQVIQALLTKFTVADNPAKYALYKRCCRDEQEYMCKLSEGEHPLFLRLLAGPNTDMLGFVLREQQTGEVMWDAFSIPELSNFLRMLEKEETERVCSVTRRYDNYRLKLQEAMRAAGGPG